MVCDFFAVVRSVEKFISSENKENRYTIEITTGWHWKSFRSYKTIRFRKLTVEIADNVVFVFERPYVGKPTSYGMVYYEPMDVANIVSRL